MKQGILSFKGTVREFRVFLKGLRKDISEGIEYDLPPTRKVTIKIS